eukprot:TRINITY_DN33862_c0_g1_i1.p1 TRINITY_DN33862_c0_g1~~TRINITY_DN33862_c0_g1_i1.p1  ORF type:complete len:271 (-),score=51.93 TRINITY_DN33862_c0_g1_i1:72-827(-)
MRTQVVLLALFFPVCASLRQSESQELRVHQNTTRFFCPSFCVPCTDGRRTILLQRSRDKLSVARDVGMLGVGIWAAASAPGLITQLAMGLVTAAGAIGKEALLPTRCPHLTINYMDPATDTVSAVNASNLEDDSPLKLFMTDANDLYHAEIDKLNDVQLDASEVAHRRLTGKRPKGELPASWMEQLDTSEVFCGNNGMVSKDQTILEESWHEGIITTLSSLDNIADRCRNLAAAHAERFVHSDDAEEEYDD